MKRDTKAGQTTTVGGPVAKSAAYMLGVKGLTSGLTSYTDDPALMRMIAVNVGNKQRYVNDWNRGWRNTDLASS